MKGYLRGRRKKGQEEKEEKEEDLEGDEKEEGKIYRKRKIIHVKEFVVDPETRLLTEDYKDSEERLKAKEELQKKSRSLVEEQKKSNDKWGKQFDEECYRFEREWRSITDAVKNQ